MIIKIFLRIILLPLVAEKSPDHDLAFIIAEKAIHNQQRGYHPPDECQTLLFAWLSLYVNAQSVISGPKNIVFQSIKESEGGTSPEYDSKAGV
ncbi:hypothetical protein AL013_03090 [Mariprofundus ferrooxydans]|uniref:Uncharacterized protein n=1 Tax=Mariprofundus ferrooxydans PV-1 TaxID=314345 RepID=Q0EX68_9PROT|nr:hypothetical protein SPV1_08291 [Mariprofundus ferrooxydans PV-1]KON48336.1 hypothetical protein AL013_03090 [Mariprofundus ferrooxydans]